MMSRTSSSRQAAPSNLVCQFAVNRRRLESPLPQASSQIAQIAQIAEIKRAAHCQCFSPDNSVRETTASLHLVSACQVLDRPGPWMQKKSRHRQSVRLNEAKERLGM